MHKFFLPVIVLCILIVGCIPDKPLDSDDINDLSDIYTKFSLQGAKVVANDGTDTFLGEITGEYHINSIFNNYGMYGSKYSVTSISIPSPKIVE